MFEQLVACILSVRTRDEASLPVALRLFARARTPAAVAMLPGRELIHGTTFPEPKARDIRAIAKRVRVDFPEGLPADFGVLTSFRGVGPKCANLVLGAAAGIPAISVDVHVHRIANRWGYVRSASPEGTLRELEAKVPRRHWIEINRLLVPFGKHVCTGLLPRCSECPLLPMCRQVGVARHR